MAKRLFVGNLAHIVRENDLRELLSTIGDIDDVSVVAEGEGGRLRCAFVEMTTEAGAADVIRIINGRPFGGRPLTVRHSDERGDLGPLASGHRSN